MAKSGIQSNSLLKVLLDEDRLKILGLLALGPCSVDELTERTGLKPSTLPRHLAMLAETGLVAKTGAGNNLLYALAVDALQALKRDLFATAEGRQADLSGEEQVLANFLDGERLIEIPAKHAKRLVILAWLADKFEPGVEYPERTVSEMLERHHPDYASLRRHLVDYGFMQRERGIYRRSPIAQT